MAFAMEPPSQSPDAPGETRSQRYRRRKAARLARKRRYYRNHRDRLVGTRRIDAFAGYERLVKILVARRVELGWSQAELDERAGFQEGYCGKLEAWRSPHGRVAGSVTLPLWLQALGIGFVPAMVVGKVGWPRKAKRKPRAPEP